MRLTSLDSRGQCARLVSHQLRVVQVRSMQPRLAFKTQIPRRAGSRLPVQPRPRFYNVSSCPPTRTTGSHHRPPTRQSSSAQELLPRLQIVDSVYCIRSHLFADINFQHRRKAGITGDLSRPFHLSRPIRQNSNHRPLPSLHSRRRRSGWLDQQFFLR